MKQLFFYALFGLFSASGKATDNAEVSLLQTFSKPHTKNAVTQSTPVRLKEIDVANPLFIFR